MTNNQTFWLKVSLNPFVTIYILHFKLELPRKLTKRPFVTNTENVPNGLLAIFIEAKRSLKISILPSNDRQEK
jgi:hypothetical protein